jgi:hypothetical protein
MARQYYNAVGDDFFPDDLVYNWIWGAQLEAAQESFCIERVYTADSVASQQEYSFPENAIAIKNLKYNGRELDKISQQDYDAMTYAASTAPEGTPRCYYQWASSIFLYPTPDTAITGGIQIFTYDRPEPVTSVSTLDLDTQFHIDVVHYCVAQMFAMDQNAAFADRYQGMWTEGKERMKVWARKKRRGDKMAQVQRDDLQAPLGVFRRY